MTVTEMGLAMPGTKFFSRSLADAWFLISVDALLHPELSQHYPSKSTITLPPTVEFSLPTTSKVPISPYHKENFLVPTRTSKYESPWSISHLIRS